MWIPISQPGFNGKYGNVGFFVAQLKRFGSLNPKLVAFFTSLKQDNNISQHVLLKETSASMRTYFFRENDESTIFEYQGR